MQLDSVMDQEFTDPVDLMSTQRGVARLKVEGRIERLWAFSDAVPEISARSREKHIDFSSAAWRWFVDNPSELVLGLQRVTAYLTENSTRDGYDGHEKWQMRPYFKLKLLIDSTIEQDLDLKFTFFLRDGVAYTSVALPTIHVVPSSKQEHVATVELNESIFDIVYYGRLDVADTLAAYRPQGSLAFRPASLNGHAAANDAQPQG